MSVLSIFTKNIATALIVAAPFGAAGAMMLCDADPNSDQHFSKNTTAQMLLFGSELMSLGGLGVAAFGRSASSASSTLSHTPS